MRMNFSVAKIPGKIRRNKRLMLSILLLFTIALIFWTGSRYPQLNEKAIMGGETPTSGISFDIPLPLEETDPVITKIIYNTINWVDTNKKGMAFGILFASVMMMVFSLLDQSKFKSRIGNSIFGLLIGAPLGVCTNCAAPIAKGMFDAGGKREVALATMTSSPTLNLVVMGMLFSLFPLYMVYLKIGFSLIFIIFCIPLITYMVKDKTEVEVDCPIPSQSIFNNTLTGEKFIDKADQNWISAFKWTLKSFIQSLWHILKTTVPLMLLAGFLGSVFITLVPWEQFYGIFPLGGLFTTLIVMIGLALIGTFLPVPIAFDVIIVAVLLNGGFPIPYAMVLLFTLGIFSIYSFFITKQTMGLKVALTTFIFVAGLGVSAGAISHKLKIYNDQGKLLAYKSFKQKNGKPMKMTYTYPNRIPSKHNDLKNTSESLNIFNELEFDSSGIAFTNVPFEPKSLKKSNTLFQNIEASDIGLTTPYSLETKMLIEPFVHGRAVASGDINRDGWVDVVYTSDGKVFTYLNEHGRKFLEIPLNLLNSAYTQEVALVDLNNDGWLDLFATTYKKGNYVVYNKEGRYLKENQFRLPQPENLILTTAAGFADVDHDGDLDIYLGNWSIGWLTKSVFRTKKVSHLYARNCLLINNEGNFTIKYLSGIAGETLSTLLTDFNNDGHIDIVVGNDFAVSDHYYTGDGKGNFDLIIKSDQIIPVTTNTTMSTTVADINNDLKPELFLNASFSEGNYKTKAVKEICKSISNPEEKKFCMNAFKTQQLINQMRFSTNFSNCPDSLLNSCIGHALLFDDRNDGGNDVLSLDRSNFFPDSWPIYKNLSYESQPKNFIIPQESIWNEQIDQVKGSILLEYKEDGTFSNHVESYGLKNIGWSWNAKFADVDNDEWQDIFVVNGFLWQKSQETNLFFKNIDGSRFKNNTNSSGLTNFLPAHAYTYLDYDNDGDLDLIMIPAIGPIFLYKNTSINGNSVIFNIQDMIGNHTGIGSKITIYYGNDGERNQMREILASGGFKSFDSPQVHFGLGKYKDIQKLEILWSTGEKTIVNKSFEAGSIYTIWRNEKGLITSSNIIDSNNGDS